MSASSQSWRFTLSLRLDSSFFITSGPGFFSDTHSELDHHQYRPKLEPRQDLHRSISELDQFRQSPFYQPPGHNPTLSQFRQISDFHQTRQTTDQDQFRQYPGYDVYKQNRRVDVRKFTCTLCNKAFVRRLHLENHMRAHTGHKPFKCSICQKGFTQKSHIKIHERLHFK